MDDEEMAAIRRAKREADRRLGEGLQGEKKRQAKAKGVKWEEKVIEHKHGPNQELRRKMTDRTRKNKANLFNLLGNEKKAVHAETGVTAKQDFVNNLEGEISHELKELQKVVLMQPYVNTLKQHAVLLKNLRSFWMEIDREKDEEDWTIELNHFNNYGSVEITKNVEKKILKVLKGPRKERYKKRAMNPKKIAVDILELFKLQAEMVVEGGLAEVDLEEFAKEKKLFDALLESKKTKRPAATKGKRLKQATDFERRHVWKQASSPDHVSIKKQKSLRV